MKTKRRERKCPFDFGEGYVNVSLISRKASCLSDDLSDAILTLVAMFGPKEISASCPSTSMVMKSLGPQWPGGLMPVFSVHWANWAEAKGCQLFKGA
ncbi:hypothetical protein AVEN_42802-1 [Araneus ventricosus]|uniref:Uncharacterized protein n=1 Tax=Araneus ventricosus TaxID=182803 RepID=A0A4Y2AEF0_ARAVE|nr:hypothetical protein AVEN_42802-1 [Araneus ventricosus]